MPVYSGESKLYSKLQEKLYNTIGVKAKIKNKRIQNKVKIAVIDSGISKRKSNIVTSKTKNRELSSVIKFSREVNHGTHVQGIIHLLNKDSVISHYNFYKTYNYKTNNRYLSKYLKEAIDSGNKIINLSLNGIDPIKEEYEIMKYGQDKGVIFIVASGNDKTNLDDFKDSYPALYDLENIISVSNYKNQKETHMTSNYGKDSIFIGTNGTRIPSFCITYKACRFTGSSQATPIITSAVSILLERYPFLSIYEIKHILKVNSINNDKTMSGYFSYSSFIHWMNQEHDLISMNFFRNNLNMFYSKTEINWDKINKERNYYQVPYSYKKSLL